MFRKLKVFSSTLNFRKGRNQMNLVMFILLSNFAYIFANNRCFTSLLIQIEQNVNMHLQEVHVFTLSSAGIMLWRFNRYWNYMLSTRAMHISFQKSIQKLCHLWNGLFLAAVNSFYAHVRCSRDFGCIFAFCYTVSEF